MKKVQITLLVEESKELIARAVVNHKDVKKSLIGGKVVLKGGTTVSRISEKIADKPLRICGRITKRGTVANLTNNEYAHTLLIENNKTKNIDNIVDEEFSKLNGRDLVIIGANAIDYFGNAAIMAGSPGGGSIGKNMSFLYTEDVRVIIPVGLEKFIPGDITEIIKNSSRKGKDFSYGMAVGLIPVFGEIITEIEAIKIFSNVACQVIGAGGLDGANGSVTLEIWGEDQEVSKILEVVKDIKSSEVKVSGELTSLEECEAICESCKRHLACAYKLKKVEDEKKTKLGIITIGQSPRIDLTQDIREILNKNITVIELGVLDKYTYEEVIERFSSNDKEDILVSRMRDGKQIVLREEKVINELQNCIDEIEKKVDMVLLLCTGKFPKFNHKKPLIIPQNLLHSIVSKLESNNKIGAIIPDIGQIEQNKRWWSTVNMNLEIEVASPYKEIENIQKVATRFKDKPINYIVLDCMGYSVEMKKLVSKESGKKVILPRTLIARVINELSQQ
ncbi:AroM family protein [Crassaminicella profunda]|uniref:AroM family protein n=1 Tax=Crassaminicella profunda TaxID=1286698 RepID=UPI001CA69741|nr:AroM family protein [Crassaminicella profunda]QZY56626.1 AroM family protein [Crassaminicella profunda]